MKKLLSLFVPLMVMLFVYSPQQAWADTPDYFTITNRHASQKLTAALRYGSYVPTHVTLKYRIISKEGVVGEWQDYDSSTAGNGNSRTIADIPAGASMQLYGSNIEDGFGQSSMKRWALTLAGSGEAVLSGELMSIFSGTETTIDNTETLPSYAFYNFFYDNNAKNTRIFSAKDLKLSATNLGNSCYSQMFCECSNMVDAPLILPATTLTTECYMSMFSNCKALTTTPTLPATSLATSCYYNMFNGCTALTSAPELPATTLATACYSNMFSGCSSLVNFQEELPASALPQTCYQYMFQNCTALTTAPEIAATTISGSSACAYMFTGCTALTKAPSDLYATSLPSSCYNNMFASCSKLEKAPNIHATSYQSSNGGNVMDYMFSGCTKLDTMRIYYGYNSTSAVELPMGSSYWVQNVADEGVIYCPPMLTRTFGTTNNYSKLPKSTAYPWTVYSYDFTFIPVGDNWAGESNNNNKHFTWETDVRILSKFLTTQSAAAKMLGYYEDAEFTQSITRQQIEALFTEQTVFQSGTKNIYVKFTPATITFNNSNNTTLQSGVVYEGVMPVYEGGEPECPIEEGDWFFTGWIPEVVPVTGNQTYTATYAVAHDVTITVVAPEHGTLKVKKEDRTNLNVGTNIVKQGTRLLIYAEADEGYSITGWTDITPDENGRFRIMSADPQTIGVTIEPLPGVEIDCTSDFGTVTISDGETTVSNKGRFTAGSMLTLTPAPFDAEHMEFTEWSDQNTDNPRTITLTAKTTMQAVFGRSSSVPAVTSSAVSKTVTPQGIEAGTFIVYQMGAVLANDGKTYTPIDMGGGIAWADKNIGATSATNAGSYFYWGGTEKKISFSRSQFYDASGMEAGEALPEGADAAHEVLGDNWRMPTEGEWEDLIQSALRMDNVYTNKMDPSKSITLPKAGYYNVNGNSSYTSVTGSNSDMYYWSSTVYDPKSTYQTSAYYFKNGAVTTFFVPHGLPVRAVYKPKFQTIRLTVNVGSVQYVYVCEAGQQVTITADGSAANYKFLRWKKGDDVISTNSVHTFMEYDDATYTAEFEFNAAADVYQNASSDIMQIKYPLNATVSEGVAYAPIDLGYGVAWADKNIGGGTGYYYYWGGTTEMVKTSTSNYVNTSEMSSGDNLDENNDAAYANISHDWRVPTNDDWKLLIGNTTKTEYTYKSKTSDNSITLPAAGYLSSTTAYSVTNPTQHYYWSSTIATPKTGTSYLYRGQPYIYVNGSMTSGTSYYAYYGTPVRAIYKPEGVKYTLTIEVDNNETTNKKYEYVCQQNQTVTVTAHPSEGYEFDEWEEDGNMSATRTFTVTGNATYTAKFKSAQVSSHTVTGTPNDNNYGSVSGSGSVNHGSSITLTASPVEHYHFVNWTENETVLGTSNTLILENVTSDHTSIIANFAIDQYTVTGTPNNSNYGSVSGSGSVNHGSSITLTASPVEHYHFVNWTENEIVLGTTTTLTLENVTSDHTSIIANFAIDQYTVTWKSEDGESTLETDANQNYGAATAFNGTIPTKASTAQYTYTFDGWATEANGAKEYNINETPTVSGNTTYYAHFSAATNKYTILWKNEDGTTLETDENVAYGTTPSYGGETPTKDATAQYTYTFNGWDSEVVAVTGAVTYTATFSETLRSYTITFQNEDGTELQSGSVNYGVTPEYTGETPTKEADTEHTYTFSGWTPALTSVTGEVTYTATYSTGTNSYTIRFLNWNNDVLQSSSVAYGTTPEYTGDAPTKASDLIYSYTFSGWDKEITAVDGNKDYKAVYTPTDLADFDLVDDKNENDDYYDKVLSALIGKTRNVTYKRTMSPGQWNVVSLPFDFSLITNQGHPFNGNIYAFDNANYTNDGSLNYDFVPVTTKMEANRAYVFYSNTEAEDVTFNNVEIKAVTENYAISKITQGYVQFRNTTYREQLNANGPDKHKVYIYQNKLYFPNTSPIWMRAFRGYFYLDIPDGEIHHVNPRLRIINGGQVTTELEAAEPDNCTEVNKYIERGILIIERNGVKYNAQGAKME